MKVSTRKQKNKLLIITAGLGVIILLCGISYYVYASYFTTPVQQPPTLEDQSKNTPPQKPLDSKIDSHSQDSPPAPIPQENGKDKVELAITSYNQGGTAYQIRSIIYAVVSDGECTLILTKSDEVIVKKSPVQALPNSATCQGFDVPLSELSSGNWQVNLKYENDNISGATSVTIAVD